MFLFNKKLKPTDFFPSNYVDIHSHLLPGIDDGAKDIKSSIALIKHMYSSGIKQFRTTPHVMGDVWENSSSLIKEKEFLLKNTLKTQGYTDIELNAAAEYMLDENFDQLLDTNDILTLKDNYILIEMSFFNTPYNLKELLIKIKQKGYVPILAHPERYHYYHNDFSQYEKLRKMGCLFQLNILSLTNHYGKSISKIAYKLLKEKQFTFVGSDTHHQRHLQLMESLMNSKTKKLLTPLFLNNIDTFSF